VFSKSKWKIIDFVKPTEIPTATHSPSPPFEERNVMNIAAPPTVLVLY